MAKFVTRMFPKEDLKDLMWGDNDDFVLILDEITDTSRWSIHHYMVFKEISSGKLYGVGYSCGATESQDEAPFEFEGDEIECNELEAVEVKKIEYQPVKA